MITAIIAVICTLAISVPVTFYVTSNYRKKQQEETIGNAQEKARAIIDEALTTDRKCAGEGQSDHRRGPDNCRDQEARGAARGQGRVHQVQK